MKTTPIRAIRTKCSACAGSPRMATRCENEGCSLYPYRTGRNPARVGIGRLAPCKDAHSGKFRPSQDGLSETISGLAGEGTGKTGSSITGDSRLSSGVQVDGPRISAEIMGEMMLRGLSGGGK
jgi:hypothetical protein